MDDNDIKRIPINELRQEDGASDLASSPDMEPYLEYLMAAMQGADVAPHLEELSKLPLEKRYVWRVASAFKWGLADFDEVTVAADRDTLTPEDFAKVMDLLKLLRSPGEGEKDSGVNVKTIPG